MVAHSCNLGTWEGEKRDLLSLKMASMCYKVRFYLKIKQKHTLSTGKKFFDTAK